MMQRLVTLIPIISGLTITIIGMMLIVTLTLKQPAILTYILAGVYAFTVCLIFGKVTKKIYYSFQ